MKQFAKYVNHKGESIELNGKYLRLNNGQLQDWGLSHTAINGRTASFSRPRKEIAVEAVIVAASSVEGAAIKNYLYDVAIVDVEANKPGRLYIGDWYMEGFFVRSNKGRWWYTDRVAEYSLAFLTDSPMWTREHDFSFWPISSNDDVGLNHPYDFEHNYGAVKSGAHALSNPSVLAAPAKIDIYGPVEKPRITIGENVYEVDTVVPAGGVLTIDSVKRTIIKKDKYGAISNCFQYRVGNQRKGGGSYIFEPIPAGVSRVTWDGSFGFDLTLYEKRDEWRW